MSPADRAVFCVGFQRSLMCYKSILVMRSIPEILEGTHDNTSLAISRHLIEESTSSSTSGSSSDNENSHFPKKRHFGSAPELHLSIFDTPSSQEPPKHAREEKHSKLSIPPIKPMRKKYAAMKSEVKDKSPTESKELVTGILKEQEEGLQPRSRDEIAELSQRSGEAETSSVKTSSENASDLSQKQKPDILLSEKDKTEKAGDGAEKPPVCVPRQSVIKSTFYSQAAELPARTPSSPSRELRRHLDRARRTFRKAGYSKVPLSGLREPLLEQFELEEEEGKSDDDDHRESLLGSLTKSASFDTARKPPHPAIAGSSRSRSLDDYRLRASRSVREQDILEEDCDITAQESCPEGSEHCDISTGPGKGCSAGTSEQEDFRRASKDRSEEQLSPSTQCEGNGCPAVCVQQLDRLPVSPQRSENRKHLLKKSKATYVEEEAGDLEGKSPILSAQHSDVTAPSAQKHEIKEDKSPSGSARDTVFQEGEQAILTVPQSETTSRSAPGSTRGAYHLPQESARSTDTHPEMKGEGFLIKRTAPAPPWKDKRQKHSNEKPSPHSVVQSDLMEHESSSVPTGPQTETDSLPVCKEKSQQLSNQITPAPTGVEGKQPGVPPALQTAGEHAHQKPKTYKEVRSAALEDKGPSIAGIAPLSAPGGEREAHKKASVHADTTPAILQGEHPVVSKVLPPKPMRTAIADRARHTEREQPAYSKERLAALRSEGSSVPSSVHEAEILGKSGPQKASQGSGVVPAAPEGRHMAVAVSSQNTGLPSVYEREKQEHPRASLHSEVRSAVTTSGSPEVGQTSSAPCPEAGSQVFEQHKAVYPGGKVSAALEGTRPGILSAPQPDIQSPAAVYQLEYEEHLKASGEGRDTALESGSCDDGKTVPPLLHGDRGQELSHHRSSFYSDEESAVLEGLVDEMVSLSEEMNVWAESVSGQEECRKHLSPTTEMFYKRPDSQTPTDTSCPSVRGGEREVSELDDLAEPYLAVSEEPEAPKGQGAQTVPHECEDLEDLAFESLSSSQTSVSPTESLDAEKTPGDVPVSKDTGRHPEVSLVKIKDLSDEAPSPTSGTPKLDISEVEPAYLNFSDLYDIVYFPFEFMNFRKPPPKPTGRRFIPFSERARARSPPAGHLHKDKRLCIREEAEGKNRKNHLEISEDSKAASPLVTGKGSESLREMYGPQKESSGKQKSSFYSKPGLFKPYGRSHSVEQSVEQSLKKKVKASVAHISRILKGKTSPEPEAEEGKYSILCLHRLSTKSTSFFFPSVSEAVVRRSLQNGQWQVMKSAVLSPTTNSLLASCLSAESAGLIC